jgi:hypothetical protein
LSEPVRPHRRFGWVAVIAADDEERTQSALSSFYV